MAESVYVPSTLKEGYFADVPAPVAGDNGKALVYNHATLAYVYTAFEASGAVAAHVLEADPHAQYTLSTELVAHAAVTSGVHGISAFGATLVDDAAASNARTTLGLGTIATEAETGYLLATGARAGGTTTRQSFASGLTITGGVRPASNTTTALQWQNATGALLLNGDTTNMSIGIGNTAGSLRRLYVETTPTITSGEFRNFEALVLFTPTANSNGNVRAVMGEARAEGSTAVNFTNRITGVESNTYANNTNASSTITDLRGFYTTAYNQNANAVTNIYGLFTRIGNAGAGNVGTVRGVHVDPFKSGAGTISDFYGIYVGAVTQASVGNYAIYTNAGLVRFGDKTLLAAGTTAAASLNIASGVAPTSPNAGDLWTDGTDFYGRGAASYSFGAVVRTTAIRPLADSTTALQLQNAAGTAIGTWDTTNGRLGIGITPTVALEVLGPSGYVARLGNGTVTAGFITAAYFGLGTITNTDWRFFTDNVSTRGVTIKTSTGRFGVGTTSPGSIGHFKETTALTNTIQNTLIVEHSTSGTPAANFGLAFRGVMKSDTTDLRDGGRLIWQWIDPTDASRASKGQLTSYYISTEREAITWLADSDGSKVGISNPLPTALLDVAASTTARASLRLRHGVAPTSPNDGDIWTTTTGLFVRINGVTKTVTLT